MYSTRLGSLPNNEGASPLTGFMIQRESRWFVVNNNLKCWIKVFCVYRGGKQCFGGLGRHVYGSVRGSYLVAGRTKRRVRKLRGCVIRQCRWVGRDDGSYLRSWDNGLLILKTPYVVKQMYFSGYLVQLVGRLKLKALAKRSI